MRYRVKYVPDDQLPNGRDWLLCRWGDMTALFLRRSMVLLPDAQRARILEEAWDGCRRLLMPPEIYEADKVPVTA